MTTKNLQNGSDIRGIALPGVPGEAPNLGEKETERLSYGYLLWLSDKYEKSPDLLKIAVGMDPRLSGPDLKKWIIETLTGYGVHVYDCGLASTPAMFMSTVFPETDCDGAIMITASHLPFNRNGFKYFSREGGLDKADIKQITETADSGSTELDKAEVPSVPVELDLISIYSDHLKKLIIDGTGCSEDTDPRPLEGMRITVDAGNGGGGFFAEKVLKPLGADVSTSQFLEPDGNFPNHAPNPEDAAAMASVCARVKECGTDFGLIFDTDVDRSAAVDRSGNAVSRNEIVALAAALIADEHPGTTVVTDSITSVHLNRFLENDLGLKHLRYRRGYRNVINRSVQLNMEGTDSQLAIETSGHAAFRENYFLDDGAYLAVKIVIKAALLKKDGRTLDQLIASLEKPAEAREIRMKLKCDDFAAYGDNVLEELRKWASGAEDGITLEEPNYEGVRINFAEDKGNGWALLRKSLHDPIMPLNIESDSEGGCDEIAAVLRKFLAPFTDLDTEAL